ASRIAATVRSTSGSCADSKARSAANALSKPGSSVERRLTCTRRLAKGLDERRDRRALQLERCGIHDEPARNRQDFLDHPQAVRAQRVAGIDQVHDGIG